ALNASAMVEGKKIFEGLIATGLKLKGFKQHLRLLASYEKLYKPNRG
ncbi:MAG: hypothetical protein ACI9QV_001302, partial [Methylophagaceae bacterium]